MVDMTMLLNEVDCMAAQLHDLRFPQTKADIQAVADKFYVNIEYYDYHTRKLVTHSNNAHERICVTFNPKTKLFELVRRIELFIDWRLCLQCGERVNRNSYFGHMRSKHSK